MKRLRTIGLLFVVLLMCVQGIILAGYWRDQQNLEALFHRIASPSLPPSVQAKLIANYLEMKSSDTNPSYLLLPSFRFLSATPWQVAHDGGNCADRSRFMVVLLRMRGIRASKWALYGPDGKPVHAVLEMESEQGKMVIDPLFDMWFPRPGGGYHDIQDLQRNPEILRQRVQTLRATGEEPLGWLVLGYPTDRYIYDHARTINWDKSLPMRLVYRMVYAFLGEGADQIQRPFFVEQPALMIVFAIGGVEALLLLVWLGLLRNARPRRTTEFTESAWSASQRPVPSVSALRSSSLSGSVATRQDPK